MEVKQLINKLREINQDKEVYLSSDNEGNSFARIEDIEENKDNIILFPSHENYLDEEIGRE